MTLESRIAAMLLTAVCTGTASAQSYPTKPIRTLMTIAGTGAELMARMVAQGMSEGLGQQAFIEVQSAAGGMIANEAVMKAAPDGHTILLASAASQLLLARRLGADASKSLTPITRMVDAVLVVVSNPALPVNSVTELIAHIRKNPGKVFYSHSSVGGNHHLSGEQIRMLANIDFPHVPYKGGTQALMDTVSGQVQVNFAALSSVVSLLKAQKVRLLGINNSMRHPSVPDIPTITEQVPGYQPAPAWLAYFGPAGMPAPVLQRLGAEIRKNVERADVRAKADELGFVAVTSTSEELLESVKRDVALTNRIVEAAGVKFE
jgi:tripartite-type tricarboxylate transporter receptor subunit TctC